MALGILKQAEQQESDLLVKIARGMDALAAALLGSTTAQVVREMRIPTRDQSAGVAAIGPDGLDAPPHFLTQKPGQQLPGGIPVREVRRQHQHWQ